MGNEVEIEMETFHFAFVFKNHFLGISGLLEIHISKKSTSYSYNSDFAFVSLLRYVYFFSGSLSDARPSDALRNNKRSFNLHFLLPLEDEDNNVNAEAAGDLEVEVTS